MKDIGHEGRAVLRELGCRIGMDDHQSENVVDYWTVDEVFNHIAWCEERERAAARRHVDFFEAVFQFHVPVDMNYVDGMREDIAVVDLRRKLIEEEAAEIAEGFGYDAPPWKPKVGTVDTMLAHSPEVVDHVKLADGLCDEIYVCIGGLLALYPKECAYELMQEVCRSNMSKFPDGKAIRREDGKVLKPPTWSPPDIAGILRKHGVIP